VEEYVPIEIKYKESLTVPVEELYRRSAEAQHRARDMLLMCEVVGSKKEKISLLNSFSTVGEIRGNQITVKKEKETAEMEDDGDEDNDDDEVEDNDIEENSQVSELENTEDKNFNQNQ
jgi:hypothetical protein